MRIGIPTEIKPKEGRVALVPAAAAEIVRSGHEVYLQSGAGVLRELSGLKGRYGSFSPETLQSEEVTAA